MEKENKNKLKVLVHAGICVDGDGFYVAMKNGEVKSKTMQVKVREKEDINEKIFSWLNKYAIENNVKIVGAGIVGSKKIKSIDNLTADLWLKEDIVPFIFDIKWGGCKKKAESAALEVAKNFANKDIVDIKFDEKRRVKTIRLARLDDFKKTVKKKDFETLLELSEKFKRQNGWLLFFSSTPRGGGVALMRHALIRLFRLLEVPANWYVMSSKKEAFEITKKKFHNILQGVAPKESEFTQEDKQIISDWIEKNVRKFSKSFKRAKVVVIDDPQPAGMIPYIKKINPAVKIIYRSHIQIETKLMKKEGSQQQKVWNYLWENIKHADLFVSHPVERFIPHNVPKEKIVLMAAATDNLDGLNKKLSRNQMKYYLDIFSDILEKTGQKRLKINRPYIVQVARFDPSKGIPDVLESYRKLRRKLKKEGVEEKRIPQLIIVGHGSVDDPEAAPIYNEVRNMVQMDTFAECRDDIKVARLPHSDQILNALMRGAKIALQLSRKEGFEVKVSEALDKGKPVIAYRTGGIPLQIEHGTTGYLVKVGGTKKVSEYLYDLLTDKEKYKQMSLNAKKMVNRDYFTIGNAIKWLFLANELIEKDNVVGNKKYVRELIGDKK